MKNYLVFFILLLSQFSFSQNQVATFVDSLRGANTKERACFDVYYYDLSVKVNIQKKTIAGKSNVYFLTKESTSTIQLDLDSTLSILSIVNEKGSALSYKRKANAIFIVFDSSIKRGESTYVTIDYEGIPKIALDPPWEGGFIWTTDSLGKPWVGVACEGLGASSWWPCKDLSSDEPDSIRMHFEVPEALFCAANGNLEGITLTERQTKIYHWAVHYPINLYNVTLNIGDYAQFSEPYTGVDGKTISLDYYVLSYNLEKAKKHFKQVKPILTGYEKLFGPYPCPKDGYALIETPYWGMEHQSGISYGNKYVNNMIGNLDYIIVHETGHEWWGNAVSTADHGELWIHESFTTYGEALLLEHLFGKEIALQHLIKQKKAINNEEPILGPLMINYNAWQDSDMYYKGAWMLHTLRNSLNNDSLWFAMFPAIQKAFSFKQIHSAELIDFISRFLNRDYNGFFNHYLNETGLPVLEYSIQQEKKQLTLTYRWNSKQPNFDLPITIKVQPKEMILMPTRSFKTVKIPTKKVDVLKLFEEGKFYVIFREVKGK